MRTHLVPIAIVAVLAMSLALPTSAWAQRPAMPRVRSEPCEGYCQKEWGTCKRVALRSGPYERMPVAGMVDSGQIAHVVERRRITTRPGIVVVRQTHTLTETLDGDEGPVVIEQPRHWQLTRGDTVYVIDVELDGDSHTNYVWTYLGQEDTTAAFWRNPDDPPAAADTVQMLEPMAQDWWVRVRTAWGLIGWTTWSNAWTGASYYDDPLSKCVAAKTR
jgi:hypothetical protein